MRQSCLAAAIGGSLLLLASPALARETFEIPDSLPKRYEDLYKIIKKDLGADEQENISAYLDKSQCGGWNTDLSVEGKIATVSNAPGRSGQWDGDIPSGMAVRQDDLSFPEATTGLSTLCWEGTDRVTKFVWDDYAQGMVPVEVPYPYFLDPACEWGPNGKNPDPQDPDSCLRFHNWVNGFTYTDCAYVEDVFDDEGNYLYSFCALWWDKFTCSDEWVMEEAMGNSRFCAGEECRCGDNEPSCVFGSVNGDAYRSYYRRYETRYERDPVPDAPQDVTSKDAPIACYGFYDEFDPKTHRTEDKDKRCIIDIDLKDMKKTQEGKGQYGQNSNLPDPAPDKRNDGKYDEEKDLWYAHLGQAFSLLNDKLFGEAYGRSLGKALTSRDALDRAAQKASVQVKPDQPVAEHSFVRAFDDTADARLIATWWQEQQTRLQTYVHGPVLRLVLPSTWAIGASTDPFLEQAEVSPPDENLDERSGRIELQMYAGEDTLGEAVSFIERSMTLRVEEEPIPVIIPLADPVELRATAAAWCAWVAEQEGAADCEGAEGDVKQYMEDLTEYADAMEQYRELRAELSAHVAELLKLQQQVTKPLTDWLKENIGAYKESVRERKRIAEEVAPLLEEAQSVLRSFHDESNMPWCMNQRFTLPVYSLLDPWLPSRANGGDVSREGLPELPEPEEVPQDIVLDLSRITYMQTPITVPVLKPTQVRLELARPPQSDDIRELPDIGGEMAKIREALEQSRGGLPEVRQKGSPPSLTVPPSLGAGVVSDMKAAAGEIVSLFEGMKETYDEFWRSMGPYAPKQDEELVRKKRDLECTWGTFPCVHVEMDLVERLTRVGSRPLVMLKEDYESTGSGRTLSDVCPPGDHVCLLLHPERTEPAQGWEIRGADDDASETFLDTLRSGLRSLTFPSPVGTAEKDTLPPYDAELRDLLPGILSLPASPVLPAPSSSSNTSR